MEPADCVISLHARGDCLLNTKPRSLRGGGHVTEDVQRFIWDHCISGAIGKCHAPFVKNFLKKLILEIESNCDDVLDELYELHAEFMTSLKVGSGVGLVGICLTHVKAPKVIFSDSDLSTPSNMKLNLKMKQFSTADDILVKCLHLPWECASESELQGLKPDKILGADVLYDQLCLPHLVRLLSILLDKSNSSLRFPRTACDSVIGSSHDYSNRCNSQNVEAACNSARNASPTKHLMAYISSVIRNANTNLALVDKAKLAIANLTGTLQPASLLPYI